mmetsp:Transcript_49117/g.116959  ORF Transcript_49117/g.116959 Transcript_49117/m.116959 type:complete len:345 (+) Transcript_49117:582-1616(+)
MWALGTVGNVKHYIQTHGYVRTAVHVALHNKNILANQLLDSFTGDVAPALLRIYVLHGAKVDLVFARHLGTGASTRTWWRTTPTATFAHCRRWSAAPATLVSTHWRSPAFAHVRAPAAIAISASISWAPATAATAIAPSASTTVAIIARTPASSPAVFAIAALVPRSALSVATWATRTSWTISRWWPSFAVAAFVAAPRHICHSWASAHASLSIASAAPASTLLSLQLHACCLRPFLSHSDKELQGRPILDEGARRQLTLHDKDVLPKHLVSLITGNEAVALVSTEVLDGTVVWPLNAGGGSIWTTRGLHHLNICRLGALLSLHNSEGNLVTLANVSVVLDLAS